MSDDTGNIFERSKRTPRSPVRNRRNPENQSQITETFPNESRETAETHTLTQSNLNQENPETVVSVDPPTSGSTTSTYTSTLRSSELDLGDFASQLFIGQNLPLNRHQITPTRGAIPKKPTHLKLHSADASGEQSTASGTTLQTFQSAAENSKKLTPSSADANVPAILDEKVVEKTFLTYTPENSNHYSKLARTQNRIARDILRVHKNLKKLPVARRTQENIAKVVTEARFLWNTFVQNHCEAERHSKQLELFKYFASGLFATTKSEYKFILKRCTETAQTQKFAVDPSWILEGQQGSSRYTEIEAIQNLHQSLQSSQFEDEIDDEQDGQLEEQNQAEFRDTESPHPQSQVSSYEFHDNSPIHSPPRTPTPIPTMGDDLPLADLLNGIKMFEGEPEKLPEFITNCDLYHALAPDTQKAMILTIIKHRLAQSVKERIANEATFVTWEALRAELKAKIKKAAVSYDGVMSEMAMVRQKNNESIQDYGNRVKIVLKKLHEASSRMCPEAAGALRIANERNAINKFEQNLLDTTLRITVNATSKDTLEQSIIIAMEKEIWLKGSNVVSCTICKKAGHSDSECRTGSNAIKCYNCNKPGHVTANCRSRSSNTDNGSANNSRNAGNNRNFNRNGRSNDDSNNSNGNNNRTYGNNDYSNNRNNNNSNTSTNNNNNNRNSGNNNYNNRNNGSNGNNYFNNRNNNSQNNNSQNSNSQNNYSSNSNNSNNSGNGSYNRNNNGGNRTGYAPTNFTAARQPEQHDFNQHGFNAQTYNPQTYSLNNTPNNVLPIPNQQQQQPQTFVHNNTQAQILPIRTHNHLN